KRWLFLRWCIRHFAITKERLVGGLGYYVAQLVTQLRTIDPALLTQLLAPPGIGQQRFHRIGERHISGWLFSRSGLLAAGAQQNDKQQNAQTFHDQLSLLVSDVNESPSCVGSPLIGVTRPINLRRVSDGSASRRSSQVVSTCDRPARGRATTSSRRDASK